MIKQTIDKMQPQNQETTNTTTSNNIAAGRTQLRNTTYKMHKMQPSLYKPNKTNLH